MFWCYLVSDMLASFKTSFYVCQGVRMAMCLRERYCVASAFTMTADIFGTLISKYCVMTGKHRTICAVYTNRTGAPGAACNHQIVLKLVVAIYGLCA